MTPQGLIVMLPEKMDVLFPKLCGDGLVASNAEKKTKPNANLTMMQSMKQFKKHC
jgi:hypothetical protein